MYKKKTDSNDLAGDEFLNSLNAKYKLVVKIRKLRVAKRITLRICYTSGELRITVPAKLRLTLVNEFISKNMIWIESQLQKLSPQRNACEGDTVPVFGHDRAIVVDQDLEEEYLLRPQGLIIPKRNSNLNQQIRNILIIMANEFFTEDCKRYTQKLGVSFSKISFKDPKSRWGSCSSNKKLMFSWRLIMAPKEVCSYVAAHEVAHLIHMNHSSDFWDVVNALDPNFRAQRSWLRNNGKKLHRLIF